MLFRVGEKVVYPNHGVATIENISTKHFGAQFERFYLLRLSYSSLTVMVPFSHVRDLGLRPVTKQAEINKVLSFLSEGRTKCPADWKNRFKENSEKMRTGSLLDIAQVFKMLVALQCEKPLSFREKKMLDRARQMLIAEVSVVRGIREHDAESLLAKSLSKSALPLPAAM
jgi:CarD family transcriptional regulator